MQQWDWWHWTLKIFKSYKNINSFTFNLHQWKNTQHSLYTNTTRFVNVKLIFESVPGPGGKVRNNYRIYSTDRSGLPSIINQSFRAIIFNKSLYQHRLSFRDESELRGQRWVITSSGDRAPIIITPRDHRFTALWAWASQIDGRGQEKAWCCPTLPSL